MDIQQQSTLTNQRYVREIVPGNPPLAGIIRYAKTLGYEPIQGGHNMMQYDAEQALKYLDSINATSQS